MRSDLPPTGTFLTFSGQLPWLTAALLAIGAVVPATAAPTPGPVVAAGAGSYRQGLPDANELDATWRKPSQIVAWGPGGVPVYGPAVPYFKGVGATSSQWWSGLAWHYWGTQASGLKSVPNYAWPMAFQARPEGVGMWTPDAPSIARDNGGKFDWMAGNPIEGVDFLGGDYQVAKYQHMYDQDLIAGLEGMRSADPYVTGYSDWAVSAQWEDGASKLDVTSASGSPFMYFKRTAGGANAKVEVTGGLTVWANNGNVLGITVSKAAANYRPGSSHHYALFAPAGANWVQNGSSFVAPLGVKGYFSVAALPSANSATLADFQQVAYNFITDTRFSWDYNEAEAKLTSRFHIATRNMETGALDQPTLTGIFPHAWKSNLNDPSNTDYTYQAANGQMKVVRGNDFNTQMRFTGVLPTLPVTATVDKARLNGWINEVTNDPNKLWQTPPEGTKDDVYWNGRSLGRLTELLDLAVQSGNTAARDRLLAELKPNLQNWLSYSGNEGNRYYAYDPAWRTLCPAYDVHFSCRDLSDHYFINGYYIRAAAAIAMHDPAGAAWIANWGPMIEHLVKDPFNWDRSDTRYPFLRHYSPMDGHTWAGGIAFGDGLNEESSSEAINFASALVLYGSAAGNKTIRDLGIMHYVNQSRAIEEYVFDVDGDNFAPEYKPNNAGMVWSNGRVYGTWWTAEPRAVLGINLLPIQPGSVYLGRRTEGIVEQIAQTMAYQRAYESLPDGARGPKLLMGPNEWSDLWWSYKALVDADGAALDFEAGLAHPPEFGNTKADTYAWIYSLKALGHLETGVTADVPTYNVFNKNGIKHYAAYNPGPADKCVKFSDGRAMMVPAKKMVLDGASTTCGGGTVDTTAPSVPAGLALSNVSAGGMTLSWGTSTDNPGGSGMASYDIHRARAGAGATLVGTTNGTSFSDTGLAAATDYVYSAVARDVAGNASVASAAVRGRTLAAPVDVTPPSNPAQASVGGATSASLVLSWSAASDNAGGSGMAGYDIYRGAVKVGNVGAAVLAYTDSGLAAGTSYSYLIRARDVAGNVASGVRASGATVSAGPDVTAPATPLLTLAAVGGSSMSLRWNLVGDNAGGSGMAGYDIQRYGTTIASVGAAVSTFTDQNLALNTPYGYTVKARDLAGNVSAASNAVEGRTGQGTPDITPPSVVSALVAETVGASSVALRWGASTDNSGGSGVAGYDVYRDGARVALSGATSYTDAGLAPLTTYSYTVRARDAAGNQALPSAALVVKTLAAEGGGGMDARTQMQAESFAAKDPRIVLVAGGTAVGGTANGSWIRLANVNFGATSPTGFTINVASGLSGSGSISLYKGGISAANRIGTMGVGSTGGWSTWRQIPMNLGASITGTADLIIEFSTPYSDPNGLVNVDWIKFN